MFKKVSKVAACAIIALSMTLTPFVSAKNNNTTGAQKKLSLDEKYELAEQIVEDANDEIDEVVAYCISTEENDSQYAVKESDKIAKKAIQNGKKIGITIVCEYEEVVIDGETVLIDPIKVIRF